MEDLFPIGSQYESLDDEEKLQAALEHQIAAAVSFLGPSHHEDAQENIKEVQKQHKKHFDAAHQPPAYNFSDLVKVNDTCRKQRKRDKLKTR